MNNYPKKTGDIPGDRILLVDELIKIERRIPFTFTWICSFLASQELKYRSPG